MTNDDKALVERLRDEDSYYRIQESHWCIDAEELERQRLNAADRIEALSAENERLRLHLDVALETLAEEGVCGDECITCKEARAALGEQQ